MDVSLSIVIIIGLLGIVLGGISIWFILSGRLNTAREQGRGEGQVERATLQERLNRADGDLAELRNELTEHKGIMGCCRFS